MSRASRRACARRIGCSWWTRPMRCSGSAQSCAERQRARLRLARRAGGAAPFRARFPSVRAFARARDARERRQDRGRGARSHEGHRPAHRPHGQRRATCGDGRSGGGDGAGSARSRPGRAAQAQWAGAPVAMPFGDLTVSSGKLVRWLKRVGDKVAAAELVAEIETDKAGGRDRGVRRRDPRGAAL